MEREEKKRASWTNEISKINFSFSFFHFSCFQLFFIMEYFLAGEDFVCLFFEEKQSAKNYFSVKKNKRVEKWWTKKKRAFS